MWDKMESRIFEMWDGGGGVVWMDRKGYPYWNHIESNVINRRDHLRTTFWGTQKLKGLEYVISKDKLGKSLIKNGNYRIFTLLCEDCAARYPWSLVRRNIKIYRPPSKGALWLVEYTNKIA